MKSKNTKPAKSVKAAKSAKAAKISKSAKAAKASAKKPVSAKSPRKVSRKDAPASAPKSTRPVPALVKLICASLDEKRAENVRVLRVGNLSSITDYLVIATGTSEPHLRALRVELEKTLDANGTHIVGMDTGAPGSGWLVIDAFDVMIHVLTHENRQHYSLERLWNDAEEVSVDAVVMRPSATETKKAKKSHR